MTGYQIYSPTVTSTTVVDPYNNPAGLKYVSNSSIAHWGGLYWAIMDGSTTATYEGAAAQYIWVTTSPDAKTWSAPYKPFRDATYCTNPVTDGGMDWQPNLVVVGNELWCTWCGSDAYVSKLSTPTGKWTNHRFEFSGQNVFLSTTVNGAATSGRALQPTIGGLSDWTQFPSSNPIVLSSGAVACPLTLQSKTQSTQTTATSTFTKALKHNALFLCDNGAWSMSLVDTAAFGDFCAWEPFLVEDPDRNVWVYTRNLDARVADDEFLLVSVSTDGGKTFAPSTSTNMLVPSTRGFANQVGRRRWLMVHNDHPQDSDKTPNQKLSAYARRNGSLFWSRRGGDDFVAGTNFAGDEISMNYPQFIAEDDRILVNYTANTGNDDLRRPMKLVEVKPPPADGVAYIHPRSINTYHPPTPVDPDLVAGAPPYYKFLGTHQVWSNSKVATSGGVTYATWVSYDYDGTIFMDSRQAATETEIGQVLWRGGLSVSSLNFLHGIAWTPYKPTFMAATVDNTTELVTVYFGNGEAALSKKTGYYKCLKIATQPADGATVAANGVTYTFRTSASAANDVLIGATTSETAANLVTTLKANQMAASNINGGTKVMMTRTDLASFTVSSATAAVVTDSVPLNGGKVSFGMKSAVSTSLGPFAGKMYEAKVFTSALTEANINHLYNQKATVFGYPALAGATAPAAPLLNLDPAAPNATEFPSVGKVTGRCEIVNPTTLRVYGQGSASVELPHGATALTLKFKLSAAPTAGERYVVATFGSAEKPVTLYVDGANPTGLYVAGKQVATITPTAFTSLPLTVSTRKVTFGSVEVNYVGRPRCYLGDAYPAATGLPVSKYVEFDVPGFSADKA